MRAAPSRARAGAGGQMCISRPPAPPPPPLAKKAARALPRARRLPPPRARPMVGPHARHATQPAQGGFTRVQDRRSPSQNTRPQRTWSHSMVAVILLFFFFWSRPPMPPWANADGLSLFWLFCVCGATKPEPALCLSPWTGRGTEGVGWGWRERRGNASLGAERGWAERWGDGAPGLIFWLCCEGARAGLSLSLPPSIFFRRKKKGAALQGTRCEPPLSSLSTHTHARHKTQTHARTLARSHKPRKRKGSSF